MKNITSPTEHFFVLVAFALQEMTIGDGPKPNDGDRVAVHYSLFYKGKHRGNFVDALSNGRAFMLSCFIL